MKVNKHLFEGKSQFQRIDVFDSDEFGKYHLYSLCHYHNL
ncbi:hypothetical protein ACTPEU_20285 [Clostridioides difficile]